MKKTIFALFLLLELSKASSLDSINISLSNVLLGSLSLVLLVTIGVLISKNKKLKNYQKTIDEKDEKIQWLRKVFAQKENSLNKTIKELEKEISELNHTIDTLEQKLKEGTKNQVVAKLESLERKREELLYKLKD